jgi:hypothetical protein
MKKQYVYIGQYYHIKNKQLPLDFKFGVTNNLDQREYSLGSTKSPIKYLMIKAWEIPSNVSREQVEKFISTIFSDHKYDGCEWYDIDGDDFQDKISTLFGIISDMVRDGDFSFKEVDLDSTSNGDSIELEIEKEVRNNLKSPKTNIKIEIDDIDYSCLVAKDGFTKAFNKIVEIVGEVRLSLDFNSVFKSDPESYPEYKRKQLSKIGNFYLDCHSSTDEKFKILSRIISKYNINGKVEVVDK